MKQLLILLLTAWLLLPASSYAVEDDYYYYNPVERTALPDPTVYRADDGYFYLFATENIHNVPIYRSPDLVHWTYLHTAFTDASRPTFVDGGSVWAPDINYINGQYVLYYSMSTWGGEWACGIGVATARRIDGTYQDQGPLFTSEEIGVQNSIDPFYFEDDDGKKYLFWGSFHGIYAIELADDGLSIRDGASKQLVSGTLTEGTCIYKRNGYYYLIGSAGSCCDGVNSTYHLVVARATSLLGPYSDKNGKRATANNLSTLLEAGPIAIGPGHCSEVITDDNQQTWLLYHGYPADDPDQGRCLFLDQLQWDSNDWPFIPADQSTTIWTIPAIGEQTFTYQPVDYIEYIGPDTDNAALYDTGYVPNKNTRIEVVCLPYNTTAEGNTTYNHSRAVYAAQDNDNNGIALYINTQGNAWGYADNDNIQTIQYYNIYNITAQQQTITINDITYTIDDFNDNNDNRLTLINTLLHFPFYGQLYSLTIYDNDTIRHQYVPAIRTQDNTPVFYDITNNNCITPTNPLHFDYNDSGTQGIEKLILQQKQTTKNNHSLNNNQPYNTIGQATSEQATGIIIKGGKKRIKR